MNSEKMKIEVWTDIMCPYCYLGKVHYEKALEQFPHSDQVELEWKAFQLNPTLPNKGEGTSIIEYLEKSVGVSEENIKQMLVQIEALAKECGITSNLENSVAANTLDAHRLVKLAATKGLASEVMLLLSKAYFEEAKDYSDYNVLIKIGTSVGLKEKEVEELLHSDIYAYEVKQDIQEAANLGFDTVPTFLFNRKYALVGSQPVGAFLKKLQKSFDEWQKDKSIAHTNIETTKGLSCYEDGTCDL